MHRRRSECARKDLGMEGELPSRSPDVALEQGLRRHNIVVAQRCHDQTMLIVHCPPRAVVHETRVYATVGLRTIPEPMNKSEEHTSELQSLIRISSAVFCLKK